MARSVTTVMVDRRPPPSSNRPRRRRGGRPATSSSPTRQQRCPRGQSVHRHDHDRRGKGIGGYSGDSNPALPPSCSPPRPSLSTPRGTFSLPTAATRSPPGPHRDGGDHTSRETGVGYPGDGDPASAAYLSCPQASRPGGGQRLHRRHGQLRIRKVAPTAGVITTVAGKGLGGYSGDGGPATAAARGPTSHGGCRRGPLHRRYGQQRHPRGDPGHGHHHHGRGQWHLWLQRRWRPGHRRRAQRPEGVAVDPAGDLFIADTANNVVRKVTPQQRLRARRKSWESRR